MIKVLLVDDQKLVRLAVENLLSGEERIEVIASVGSGVEAIRQARALEPDIALVDVDMPAISGVEVTERITVLPHPPKVIALSVHTQAPWPQRLLEAGALGYVSKERSESEIIEAIQAVYNGNHYFSPTLMGSFVMGKPGNPGDDPFDFLSNRQLEIMTMLVKGQSPDAIAELLHLSPKTVYTHRDRIRSKLDVGNDVEMTHMAIRYRLLEVK